MRELSSQRLTVQVRNIKSKNFLSRVERKEVMADAPDDLFKETPLQHSTASIGDTENVEVEDNEINIAIDEHEVGQEEELRMENEAACITETIVNVEGMDVVTSNKGARQVHAEERLVLKRLTEIFETKVHCDIPSVKNVD